MPIRAILAPSLAVLLLLIAAVAAPAAFADTFVVNATDDGAGTCTTAHCTLRQAIVAANTFPGSTNTISFNLPETSQTACFLSRCFTTFSTNPIVLTTQLPDIVNRTTIDGSTQPHFSISPLVEIRGPGASIDGLTLAAGSDKSVVRSIAVTSFRFGIVVASSTNLVAGDRIGLDMTGAARGNSTGVVVEGDNNQIGGSNNDGNVISGNTGDGVVVCSSCGLQTPAAGTSASHNLIIGNLIGTNAGGTGALGNRNGVVVSGPGFNSQLGAYVFGVNGNIIGGGGLDASFRNVISGNRASGVVVENDVGTLVGGNLIGLSINGNAAVPNSTNGITLSDTPNTIVGNYGEATFACTIGGQPARCPLSFGGPNIISGNTQDGVRVFATINTHDISIISNFVGTDSSGSVAFGNGANGLNFVTGVAPGKNNHVGDSFSGDANTIAFNHNAGVLGVFSSTADAFPPVIRFNNIFSNGGLGLDDGTTAANTGAPLLASAVASSTNTTVSLQLNRGVFAGTFTSTVDFYANDSCDPSGFGEGQVYVGSATFTSDSVLDNTFTATLPTLGVGSVVTATQNGDTTSMFSQCVTVTSAGSTGTFALSPRITTIHSGDVLPATLTWTVPAPRVWRNLASIDLRLVVDGGATALQLHWDDASKTFGLAGQGHAFAPGSPNRLETEWAWVDLAGVSVVGSGPTGPSVTLKLPLVFKQHAAGHTFTVSVAASDNLGHADPFLGTATWQVAD